MIKNFLICTILSISVLSSSAIAAREKIYAEEKTYRIFDLLPDTWTTIPAIEPAIPSDFIMKDNQYGGILWGQKVDLDNSEDPNYEIQSEIIYLTFMSSMQQTGPDSFSEEDTIEQTLKEQGFTDIKIEKSKWGKYPLLSMNGKSSRGISVRHAWLGLNDGHGFTISINQFSPKEESSTVWDNFIKNTKPLSEYDSLCASGLHMLDGHSYFRHSDAAIKVAVEKRNSDGKIATVITPLTAKTTFEVDEITESQVQSDWNNGTYIITFSGVLTEKEGRFGNLITKCYVTVQPKEVDEFTLSLDLKNHPNGRMIFSDSKMDSE